MKLWCVDARHGPPCCLAAGCPACDDECSGFVFLGTRADAKIVLEANQEMEDWGQPATDAELVAAAKRIHVEDGVCEIDDDAKVSRGGDPGAYVQAWVWVYDSDVIEEDKETAT